MPVYLVQIRLNTFRPSIERIRETVPKLNDGLLEISESRFTLAWTSEDGGSFGFFVDTELNAAQIMDRLIAPDRKKPASEGMPRGSFIDEQDQVVIVKLDKDVAHQRMAQPVGWLKRQMIII